MIAVSLWTITSLSAEYTWTLDIPLRVNLPTTRALVQPVPEKVDMTVRATGWTLLRLITSKLSVVLSPLSSSRSHHDSIRYDDRALIENVQPTLGGAEVRRTSPDGLYVVVGRVDQRQVPVRNEVGIEPRHGFQVVGPVRVEPDSVTLVGSAAALEGITEWPTQATTLSDLYAPASTPVPLQDSLPGVVQPTRTTVRVVADVQETAERRFDDVDLINRGTNGDTSLTLILKPSHVSVLLRGGASDLSHIDPKMLVAYINVVQGADTLGLARPHLMPIPGFSVVDIEPDRIRYLWRRVVQESQ